MGKCTGLENFNDWNESREKFRSALEKKLTDLQFKRKEHIYFEQLYELTEHYLKILGNPDSAEFKQYHPKHGNILIPISQFVDSYNEACQHPSAYTRLYNRAA